MVVVVVVDDLTEIARHQFKNKYYKFKWFKENTHIYMAGGWGLAELASNSQNRWWWSDLAVIALHLLQINPNLKSCISLYACMHEF